MTNSLNNDQRAQPKSPEEIRAERIANLTDRGAKAEILKLQDAKEARLAELSQEQRDKFEKRLQELTQAKINSRNAPQLTPPGMAPPPALDRTARNHLAASDARTDLERMHGRQKQLVEQQFDRQIDQKLDIAERVGRTGRYDELRQSQPPHDRSDR